MADEETVVQSSEAGDASAGGDNELKQLERQLYGGDGDDDEQPQTSEKPMSKRQAKKLAKQERNVVLKAERKLAEKAAKAEQRQKKLDEMNKLTPEERAEIKKKSQENRGQRKQSNQDKKTKLRQALETGQKLVIDLEFDGMMSEGDMRHLCQQLAYSYSANASVDKPCHLHLLGFKGAIKQLADQKVTGMVHWLVTQSDATYIEHFKDQKDKLVYLTADSENELSDLEADKIYIIGGLVDHNSYKNFCYTRAKAQGIKTARLPIKNYVALQTSAVLTVNHVVQILAEYVNRRDWASVLDEVLPKRKRADLPPTDKKETAQEDKGDGDKPTGTHTNGSANEGTAGGDHPAAAAAAATETVDKKRTAEEEAGSEDQPEAKRQETEQADEQP